MKVIKHFSVVISLFVLIQGFSCIGSKDYGPVERESRKATDFNSIEVSHGIDVVLSMGSKEHVEVEAPEELMEHLITEVKGHELKIYFDRSFNWNNETKVYVEARELEKIITSGGSDLNGDDVINSKELEIKASGGSDIELEVVTNHLDINVSGGADINLSGKTRYLYANTSGGSDLKAFDLIVERAELHASGGSDIKVYVEEEMEAKASGGSDIEYMGNPQIIDTNTSSSADIRKIN